MAIFRRRQAPSVPPTPPVPVVKAWTPTVDLVSARPAIVMLSELIVSGVPLRGPLSTFARLSGALAIMDGMRVRDSEPDWQERPWKWLVAVMREAAATGDHHLVGVALLWAHIWHDEIVPETESRDFIEISIYPIPAALRTEIAIVGYASLDELPNDFPIMQTHDALLDVSLVRIMTVSLLSPGE